ncbi:MAG: MBL fold metallo-hydrolase [Candidatus Nanohaloarchaea archaeon]
MNIEVLGNVQDGGVPHLGCDCDTCTDAREDPREQRYTASIVLREDSSPGTVTYLIAASPDIRYQVDVEYIDGVFVPHTGLGHVTGLLYFGEEGPDATDLNVYCNEYVQNFLRKNDPYRYLLDRGNIEIQDFSDGDAEELQGGKIKALEHYHPQFNTETTSYLIEGEEKTLYYISDVTEFTDEIIETIKEADIAILDGTFWSRDEIDRYEEVPHPAIKESMELFDDVDTDIYFTHMNHTNPVLREDAEERQEMEDRGFEIVEKGDEFEI